MPGIELHADYDRDGRLTGSPAERAARLDWPGAIVVANLDNDSRSLPRRPASGATPPADYDLATASARDDELVPLRIRIGPGALAAGERLRLHCPGPLHPRVRLSTADGVIVPQRPGVPGEYVLPTVPAPGTLELTLQVRTIAGAAFGRLSNLDPTYRHEAREETRFELTLFRVDASGRAFPEDHGRFSVAPVILDDHLTPAVRVYMVDTGDNFPSVQDVRSAAAVAGVPLVLVDPSLTDWDTWLQDQYQHGFMQGASRSRQLILHLPRLRHENSIASITDNLEEFVNSHFRSRDLALFNDLWDRIIAVNTSDGGVLRVGFREMRDWSMRGFGLLDVCERIDVYGALADPSWSRIERGGLVATLRALATGVRRLGATLSAAASSAPPRRAKFFEGLKLAAEQLARQSTGAYRVSGSGAAASVTCRIGSQTVTLPEETADRLFARATQMHDSANYGGNIESTPPLPGAPLGKILLGNAVNPHTGADFMDPDLLRLLAKQKKQPLVEVDTTWLRVGHVDEMFAVVPHARTGFSILHASCSAAMTLLRRAETLYRSGLPLDHPDRDPGLRRPSGVLSRSMTEGAHPVTRLFRGKAWWHQHRPPEGDEVSQSYDPPRIYLRLARELGDGGAINVHRIGLVPGEGEDRRYPADITASEILFCERDAAGTSVNDTLEATVLARSRSVLSGELGVPILPVPVLFDAVPSAADFTDAHWLHKTTAFSPDIVNLQVLNGHLLAPKPYGPRMRRTDAIRVVREAMREVGVSGSVRDRVGPRLVARRRMTRERYWVEKVEPAYLTTSSGIIQESFGGMRDRNDVLAGFKDSFPGTDETELERRLIRPNARHFDSGGQLRESFSRIVVDDGMVDLFELWTAAVVEELGAVLHFVDTWAYHLGEGQIHCGTNVLRRPRRARGVKVWDAPDVEFRAQRGAPTAASEAAE
jgi:hypothetical protein